MEVRTQRHSPRHHFTFTTRSKIYGVLDDLDSVRRFTQRLIELGCQDERIEILEGDDGVRSLDPDGRYHGMIARFLRHLQAMTDERSHVEQYVHELLQGRYVVAVSVPSRELFQPICEAFKNAGGHRVNYYGPFVVESISA